MRRALAAGALALLTGAANAQGSLELSERKLLAATSELASVNQTFEKCFANISTSGGTQPCSAALRYYFQHIQLNYKNYLDAIESHMLAEHSQTKQQRMMAIMNEFMFYDTELRTNYKRFVDTVPTLIRDRVMDDVSGVTYQKNR